MATLPHDVFDRSLKRFWDLDPRPLLRLAFGDHPWTHVEPLPVELVETIRQIADRLVRVSGPEGEFLAHIEFETQPDLAVPGRILTYNVLLWTATGRQLPVRSVVILLHAPPEGFSEQVTVHYGATPIHQFAFQRLDLYQMSAVDLAASPDLAPLTPLGRGCTPDVLQQAARTVVTTHPEHPENVLAVLYLLGRVQGMTDALLGRILQMEVVRMSDVYQEITEAGRQEGLREGLREGALRMLAQVLTQRFPQHGGALDALLGQCTIEDLEWLVREALNVKQLATLRRHLEARLARR
jgi:predicted transposase YdaD